MTTVTIPALIVVGLAGDTGSVVLSYELVSAGLRPLVGLRSADGALVTCHGSKTISDTDTDNPLVSWDLTPQAQIVTPDGRPSYYRITCHRESNIVPLTVWVVQVPDLSEPIDLRDLVGSSTIQPPSVGIPAGGSESQILTKKSANDYDTEWSSVLIGASRIEVVESIPGTEVSGVIYFVTG